MDTPKDREGDIPKERIKSGSAGSAQVQGVEPHDLRGRRKPSPFLHPLFFACLFSPPLFVVAPRLGLVSSCETFAIIPVSIAPVMVRAASEERVIRLINKNHNSMIYI